MSVVDLQLLPWDQPALEGAAEWLHAEYGPGTPFDSDLGGMVLVLPGARAGRILLEALSRRMPPSWQPPDLVTAGKLTDRFIRLDPPRAPRLVRTLAWERALRGLGTGDLRALLTEPPASTDNRAWLGLAEEVREVFGKLSAECLDFQHVSSTAMDARSDGEQRRWRALARAQESAEGFLAEVGMCDPHRGRVTALEQHELIEPEREVVLVGVLEANGLARRLLQSLARVRALVFAPENAREAFDPMGFLRPAAWLERSWAVPLDHWQIAPGPDDQARRALEAIAGWEGAYSAEQITIGLGDGEVLPFLERRLHDAGACAPDAQGIDHAGTPPARLLAGVLAFLRSPRFTALAGLVRHPDVEDHLRSRLDLGSFTCAQLVDEYHREHLPGRIPPPWLPALDPRDAPRNRLAEQVGEAVSDWLAPLGGRPRPLREWAGPVREVLKEIYGERSYDSSLPAHHLTRSGLLGLAQALAELEDLPAAVDSARTAVEALELVLSEAAGHHVQPVEPRKGTPTVELLGWLELALDDAPALVLTGFNETFIPQSLTSDRYLPDSLRSELGLPDDRSRLGRDLFTLEWLFNSHERVLLLTGRHNLNGDPLRPSRLAFHGSNREVLSRVRRFLEGDAEAPEQPSLALAERQLELPRQLSEPRRWSASAIGAYLRSPYLFALRYLAGLETLDDRDQEMNALVFGDLGHQLLYRFASSPVADSSDAEAIAGWLEEALDTERARRFGPRPLPAVQLQCRQLAWRLGIFAREQAARRASGWCIEHAEWRPSQAVTLLVDGEEVALTGSIDRIDRHESGRRAILDYKFSEKAVTPEKAHQRSGRWESVQLPLYVHLAREVVGQSVPELGYFNLSKSEAECGISLAGTWSEATLAEALDVARGVIHDVRAELGRACPEFARGKAATYDLVTASVCGDTLMSLPGSEGDE